MDGGVIVDVKLVEFLPSKAHVDGVWKDDQTERLPRPTEHCTINEEITDYFQRAKFQETKLVKEEKSSHFDGS